MKFKSKKAYYYHEIANYIIFQNHNAGRKNRYDVLVLLNKHAVYIGRELQLSTCANVIRQFEETILNIIGDNWIGSQKQVNIVYNFIKELNL